MPLETEDQAGNSGTPQDAASVHQAATGLYHDKRYAEIVDLCEKSEAQGIYNADVVAVHSVALMKLHRTADTVDLLHRMLYYFPSDARLHFNLGAAYQASYQRSAARAEFQIARRLDPAYVGQKVNKLTMLRVTVAVVAFVAFFISFAFWPHTRWLVVGLIGALIVLSLFVLVMAIRARATNRILINLGILAVWLLLLGLIIFAPSGL
jgi:tetratricopeptide (TPR) repeat protein